MKQKNSTKKTDEEKRPKEPEKESPADDELPSLSHLDLEDALKKAMDVPWSDSKDNIGEE